MRDLAAIILAVLAWVIPFSIPVEDEDLAWLDERIQRADEGLKHPFTPENSPDMEAARLEYLERLKGMRARLVEGELA
jgi:hypothetical protein